MRVGTAQSMDRIETLCWIGAALLVSLALVGGVAYDNAGEVRWGDLARPAGILIAGVLAGTGVARLAYPPLLRIVPLGLYLFFLYGNLRRLIPSDALSVAVLVAEMVPFFLWFRRFDGRRLARVNVFVAAVVAVGTWAAAAPRLVAGGAAQNAVAAPWSMAALAAADRERLPDVFYVVPDRYASRHTLEREYGYDNSDFYRALEARGFVVQPDARANYPFTFESLSSTLNSTYLGHLTRRMGSASSDRRPLRVMIEDHLVQAGLRRAGYDYLHIGDWWEATHSNRHADMVDRGGEPRGLERLWPSELERVFWRGTPLPLLAKGAESGDCERLKRRLERLATVGNASRPLFVFAHLLVPHTPALTDAEGRCLEEPVDVLDRDAGWERFQHAYVEYLRFFNRAFLDVVERQLAARGSTGRELVIVLQSDEGPLPRRLAEDRNLALTDLAPRELEWKIGNLNAIRLPGAERLAREDLTTPINDWRLVFESLFSEPIERLPHRVYVPHGLRSLYDFREVTDLLIEAGGPISAPPDPPAG